MNTNVKNISEIVEDIKQNITDYQYKTIMENLMVLNNIKDDEKYKEVEAILEQIYFLKTFIPSIRNENIKATFIKRLEVLNTVLLGL